MRLTIFLISDVTFNECRNLPFLIVYEKHDFIYLYTRSTFRFIVNEKRTVRCLLNAGMKKMRIFQLLSLATLGCASGRKLHARERPAALVSK